jgi:hypothetical protein
MLTDPEWAIVEPTISLSRIKDVRKKYGVSLSEAGKYLCAKYNEITGMNETNINVIWHHIASLYGPDCGKCGKPYRTPQARYCVECGDGISSIKTD